ncbi:peptidase [Burkholderia ubonensis]|uniref:peptidase n=1 Tax=Burkholderia ubonensis TaxID=101571 RepID=UPI00075ABE3E|nr:peptidase [Burkholderia ubonensis]KVP65518.1 peptidase [Burkholderia ubonensis]
MQPSPTALSRALSIALGIGFATSAAADTPGLDAQAARQRDSLTRGVKPPAAISDSAAGQFRADGVAVTLYNPVTRVKRSATPATMSATTPEATARAFIASRATQLGLDTAALASLAVTSERKDSDFTVVRFQQQAAGLPVYGSVIAVTVAKDGRILYVANSAVTGVVAQSLQPGAVDQQQAFDRARAYLGVSGFTGLNAQRVAFVDAAGTRTVWAVRGQPKDGPRGDWELLIDAGSGEVLRAEDKAHYLDGIGYAYLPDPISPAKHYWGAPGFGGQDNTATWGYIDPQAMNAARVRVTLKDLTQNAGQYVLAGPYAVCEDFDPLPGYLASACPTSRSSTFDLGYKGGLEAVNAYYHLDTYMRYVNQTLGIVAMPYQYTGGVRYDPGNSKYGAWYSPGSGKIGYGFLYGGPEATDGVTVIHELGHAIHDWLTRGGLEPNQGISEGTAHYLAAGYRRDFKHFSPSDRQYHEVYRWGKLDRHTRTDYHVGRTYDHLLREERGDRDRGIHYPDFYLNNRYWASCNMAARDAIGGPAMDKAFLKGLSMINASTNPKAAAQAVIYVAAALGYSNEQITAIANAYNQSCTYNVSVPQRS